jgi:dienelactone hydrolase
MNVKGILVGMITLAFAANAVYAVESVVFKRADGNAVPAKVYAPNAVCRGTAILSHGAGGSENGLAYMAEFLQSQGWLAIVPGHADSGLKALRAKTPGLDLKTGLAALITDADAYRSRFADISAAESWAKPRCKNTFTALIGHSMGAATVMLLAGADNKLGLSTRLPFDAFVAMSPQGVGSIFPANAWQGINAPVYALTGTEDKELNADWTSRLQPYRSMPPGCKWQGIVAGADHRAFGQGGSSAESALITGSVLAFLDGVKAKNCAASFNRAGVRIETK